MMVTNDNMHYAQEFEPDRFDLWAFQMWEKNILNDKFDHKFSWENNPTT